LNLAQNKEASNTSQGPEFFVGLVGAIGTEMPEVCSTISTHLDSFNYKVKEIRFSRLLHDFVEYRDVPMSPKDQYYEKHMDAGNEVRTILGAGALALLAMSWIRKIRKESNGDENLPIPRCAYVLNSLKNPEEVKTLRSVYGPRFVLFAAFAPHDRRRDDLASSIADSRAGQRDFDSNGEAEHLIWRDENEVDVNGQNVSETFPRADFFVDASHSANLKEATGRFLRLAFGYPFHTPSKDEYGMFHAYAAALRSSDLSRQVGAVISTVGGDIVAVGTNEVPRAGGGLYWEGDDPDRRDFKQAKVDPDLNQGKVDPDFKRKKTVFVELFKRMKDLGWLKDELAAKGAESIVDESIRHGGVLKNTQIVNYLSFERAVHAEMAALTDAARRGVSAHKCTLYTTTFPCHNCAKHIVATGIKRVVYIEPYPKSLALQLHREEISMGGPDPVLTVFESFVGVAPRRYSDLFSVSKRRNEDGSIIAWDAAKSEPRVGNPSPTYLPDEQSKVAKFFESIKSSKLHLVSG
jgi:cytidine deaminase